VSLEQVRRQIDNLTPEEALKVIEHCVIMRKTHNLETYFKGIAFVDWGRAEAVDGYTSQEALKANWNQRRVNMLDPYGMRFDRAKQSEWDADKINTEWREYIDELDCNDESPALYEVYVYLEAD
jgi:hypothetical protein